MSEKLGRVFVNVWMKNLRYFLEATNTPSYQIENNYSPLTNPFSFLVELSLYKSIFKATFFSFSLT